MKRLILLLTMSMTMFGSCCRKFYPVSVQDSIRVETRYEYIERLQDTTIYVEIPYEIERIVTRDTVSRLSNSIAYSDAVISGGLLHHSLVNKPVSLPTKIQIKEIEVVRDSIVYRNHIETIINEVYRQTWWQKLWCTLGKWLTGIGLLYGLFMALKYYLNLKKVL
jgi:hypothetical protein